MPGHGRCPGPRLFQRGGEGLVRHPDAGAEGDVGAGAPLLHHLFAEAVTLLVLIVGGVRGLFPGGEVGVGGQQGLGEPLLIPLFSLHEPPVHPALPVEGAELLRREPLHPLLHPGDGLGLRPAVFPGQTAHDLLLDGQRLPQGVHAVGRGVLGRDVSLRRSAAVGGGAVLGLGPVLGQQPVDAGDGLLVVSGCLQPGDVVGQAHVQAADAFIQIVHISFPSFLYSSETLFQNAAASATQPSASVPAPMPTPCLASS